MHGRGWVVGAPHGRGDPLEWEEWGVGSVLTRAEIGEARWNAFVDAHPGGWWFHRWEWLAYQVARKQSEELSFGIVEGDSLVAICPLFLEERAGVRSFTMEGHPGPVALGSERWQAEVWRLTLERTIDRVAFRGHIRSAQVEPVVLDQYPEPPLFVWDNISWQTQVLDLTQSESALHVGLRHSYRSLINKASRECEIVVDREGELIPSFRLLHIQDAGRETRPRETWEMQAAWCRSNNGLVIAAFRGVRMVGATFWIVYKRQGYFASSASTEPNITHALVWRAMLELKAMGVRALELGWVDYPKDPPGLGKFKSGFGGEPRMIVAVEKRWDS